MFKLLNLKTVIVDKHLVTHYALTRLVALADVIDNKTCYASNKAQCNKQCPFHKSVELAAFHLLVILQLNLLHLGGLHLLHQAVFQLQEMSGGFGRALEIVVVIFPAEN